MTHCWVYHISETVKLGVQPRGNRLACARDFGSLVHVMAGLACARDAPSFMIFIIIIIIIITIIITIITIIMFINTVMVDVIIIIIM